MNTPYSCETYKNNGISRINVRRPSFRIYKLIKLLFVISGMYSISGLWCNEDGFFLHWYVIFNTGSAFFIWCFLRLYGVHYISSKKSKKLQIWIYCVIPWSSISRYWGKIAAIHLPVILRVLIFKLYCKFFGVNTNEIEYSLSTYTSISSFFMRRLKKNARTISLKGCLIVPCDGTVVHCGILTENQIAQVKGIDYYVNQFLGFTPSLINWKPEAPTQLFHCVLYLAPGDYHRFHSPCNWKVFKRSYFPGHILSVSPTLARWFPNLLSINERAVYCGVWKHGFFSYSAVGATNVGSIIVNKDNSLVTNEAKKQKDTKHFPFFELKRGEEMGMFNMGSTIVLIFEAPENFKFLFNVNDKVKVGSQFSILRKLKFDDFELYNCRECDSLLNYELDIYSNN